MRASNILIFVGATLLVIGVALRYFPGLFSWFGNLPGDIHRESENTTVFIPITSMLLMSLAITLVASLVSRFLGR